jgi:hypothetical protein
MSVSTFTVSIPVFIEHLNGQGCDLGRCALRFKLDKAGDARKHQRL